MHHKIISNSYSNPEEDKFLNELRAVSGKNNLSLCLAILSKLYSGEECKSSNPNNIHEFKRFIVSNSLCLTEE